MSKCVFIVAILTALAGLTMDDLHRTLGKRLQAFYHVELENGRIQEDVGFGTLACSLCHRLTNRQEVSL